MMFGRRAWFGQPPGLTILFLTNMWEQFSFYGMRALLVYYMTKQLGMTQRSSSYVYGAYAAAAYLAPIFGGVVADRWLGKRRAVAIGALIMSAGHFMMAFPTLFYPALMTIAAGNGLFLPTLPAQIDDLYEASDPRRGWAYNVYYVGINIGGFLAPLVCGTLGELVGWDYGFTAAGVGMLCGLLIYVGGRRYLPDEAPHRARIERNRASVSTYRATFVLLAAVCALVTIFRGAYEQVGNTVALWIDSGVDRRVGGLAIPMTWFQSLNPLLVFLLTPPLLAWWSHRARAGQPDTPMRRMALGAAIVAVAYLVLALVSAGPEGHRASWHWAVLFFFLLTVGELHILPSGLALFARLAPDGLGATTIAAWYLTIFFGSLFAGAVGSWWSILPRTTFFAVLVGLSLLAAILLFCLDGVARRVEERAARTRQTEEFISN
jgi:POT family proton-dependent oligopeptide transporter